MIYLSQNVTLGDYLTVKQKKYLGWSIGGMSFQTLRKSLSGNKNTGYSTYCKS